MLEMEAVDECCCLRTEDTDFIPAMIEHAEVGVAAQGGVAFLDW